MDYAKAQSNSIKNNKEQLEEISEGESKQPPTEQSKSVSSPLKNPSFYAPENKNWESIVKLDPSNANAWFNYYQEQRYSIVSKNSKKISSDEQESLNKVLADMGNNVPNSFEFHYATYINSNNDSEMFKHLEKAYQLEPYNSSLFDDFMAHYEITGNDAGKKEFAQKLKNANIYSSDLMDYNLNVLNSLETGALLITNGNEDTYPLWVQQQVKQVRPDVTVLNVDLLRNANYRNKMIASLGLTITTDYDADPNQFIREIGQLNPGKKIYYALTVSPRVLKSMSSQLYPTGLALKYSASSFDYASVLKQNWEQQIKTDHLLQKKARSYQDKKLNNNYLLPMLSLYKYYKKEGEKDKAKQIKYLMLKIAEEGGEEQKILELLK